MSVVALIVAAGSGQRFASDLPKQFHSLQGRAILRHSVERFLQHPAIDRVMVVYPPDWHQATRATLAGLDVTLVAGGQSRQQSVFLGLDALRQSDAPDHVLIHDAVRPLTCSALIDRVIAGLRDHQAVIPGLAVTDTLKQTITDQQHSIVTHTVNRQDMIRVQTPQGFDFPVIFSAHQQFADQMLTDDAALIEATGGIIAVVPGDERNLKITHPSDLALAESWAESWLAPQRVVTDFRVGSGFDVHRLVPGDGVILCGHKIAGDWALLGHSDADVGLHALCDAIFGALADGDIGQHFPPNDPQWRGANSTIFLRHALDRLAARGGTLHQIDVTLICEHPKIGPHRAAILARLSHLCGLPPDRIGLKATTTEKLGFAGRGEGIAAQAVVMVRF